MNSKMIKLAAVAAYLGLAVAAVPYLAAALYFLVNKKIPAHIDWGTWYAYWEAYGKDALQRPRLALSAAMAVAIACALPACALYAGFHSRRSLHGDARWANAGEIRKAGLL